MKIIQIKIALLSLLATYLLAVMNSQAEAQRLIPYNGYLEQNGVPFDDQMQMRFYLVNDFETEVQINAESMELEGAIWSEQFNVTVHNGRFSVALGKSTEFPELFFSRHRNLHLGIMLQVGDAWRDLNRRQRILQTAEAIEAQEANDFIVYDRLEVRSGGSVFEGAEVENVEAQDVPLRIRVAGEGENPDSEMVLDGNKINSNGGLQLQTRTAGQTTVGGTLSVRGQTTVEANLAVTENLEVQGEIQGRLANLILSEEYEAIAANGASNYLDTHLPADRHFCFLTLVAIADNDDHSEFAQCSVNVRDGTWQVQARTPINDNTDAQANCRARCMSW